MNRRIIVLILVVLLVLFALLGFYLYLTGGQSDTEQGQERRDTADGLVHVRTIYTADGENLRRPTGVGAAENGDFYVTLKDNSRIVGFDRAGEFKVKWGEPGIERGQMLAPLGVAVNNLSGRVYVVDRARLRVICYDTQGQFQWERPLLNPVGIAPLDEDLVATTFGPIVRMTGEGETVSETGVRGFEEGEFDYPRSAAQLPGTQDIVVADTNNTRVQRVTLSGEATATASWVVGVPPRYQDDPATIFGVPSGITVDEQSRVFVLDGFRYTITVLDPQTGETLHQFKDLEGDLPGFFNLPTGIAHLGGNLFAVTDTYNDRVQIIRLLLPDEDNFIARRPWLLYLLPLLLLPLLLLLLRRRVFATREALEAAERDENLRLFVGAFKRLRVLPETAEAYAQYEEQGVRIGEFLIAVGEPTGMQEGDATDDLKRLADEASPAWYRRMLSPRRLVICADAEQAEAMAELVSVKAHDYGWVLEEYQLT